MSKTISIYNRSQHFFKHPSYFTENGRPLEWFTLAPQSQGDVPVAIWEHWQKALSKAELVNLLVGGAPKDDNQKLTVAVDRATEAEKKLALKEKELENLQGLIAKLQADQAGKKK